MTDLQMLKGMLARGCSAEDILARGFHRGDDSTPVHEARLHRAYLRGLEAAGSLFRHASPPIKAPRLIL